MGARKWEKGREKMMIKAGCSAWMRPEIFGVVAQALVVMEVVQGAS
jgi:hypothetical protein